MKSQPVGWERLAWSGLLMALFAVPLAGVDHQLHRYQKQTLEKFYWSEGAALGDINQDGQADAVSGPYWW